MSYIEVSEWDEVEEKVDREEEDTDPISPEDRVSILADMNRGIQLSQFSLSELL